MPHSHKASNPKHTQKLEGDASQKLRKQMQDQILKLSDEGLEQL